MTVQVLKNLDVCKNLMTRQKYVFYWFMSNCEHMVVVGQGTHTFQKLVARREKWFERLALFSVFCGKSEEDSLLCLGESSSWAGQAGLRTVTSSGMVAANRKVGDQRISSVPGDDTCVLLLLLPLLFLLLFPSEISHPTNRAGTLAWIVLGYLSRWKCAL